MLTTTQIQMLTEITTLFVECADFSLHVGGFPGVYCLLLQPSNQTFVSLLFIETIGGL